MRNQGQYPAIVDGAWLLSNTAFRAARCRVRAEKTKTLVAFKLNPKVFCSLHLRIKFTFKVFSTSREEFTHFRSFYLSCDVTCRSWPHFLSSQYDPLEMQTKSKVSQAKRDSTARHDYPRSKKEKLRVEITKALIVSVGALLTYARGGNLMKSFSL